MLLKCSKQLFCLLSRILVLMFCVGSLAAQDTPDPANNRDVGTVRLTSHQPGVIDASWDVPEEAPDDYRIKWAKVGESYLTWTDNSGNAFPTNSSYTITGLDGGLRYKVQVRPRYDSGPRPWSDEVEIQVMASPTDAPPPPPTNTPVPPPTNTPIPPPTNTPVPPPYQHACPAAYQHACPTADEYACSAAYKHACSAAYLHASPTSQRHAGPDDQTHHWRDSPDQQSARRAQRRLGCTGRIANRLSIQLGQGR